MSKKYYVRQESSKSNDFYPTPAWATRALFEKVLKPLAEGSEGKDFYHSDMTCLEPACGKGHMSKVLGPYFHGTDSYDIHDYGYGQVRDFLGMDYEELKWAYDWVITNPPFNNEMPAKFVLKALTFAKVGVAIFARCHLMEGKWRYDNLYSHSPPIVIAPFVERVTLIKNRVTSENRSVTPYAWFIWRPNIYKPTRVMWIKPCKKELERQEDYING